MKIKIIKIIPVLIFSLFFLNSFAQDEIPEKILSSLGKGDAKVLSGFFNNNVELGILENDNVYSKAQAQQIITKFFSDNQAKEFIIIHQGGGKESAKYVIGNLHTTKEIFRVYFLLKIDKGKSYIHQLRIEKQA